MSMNIDQSLIQPTEIRKQPFLDNSELKGTSELDFSRFVDTGISVKIKVPFVRNTRNALFAINLDGFIPTVNFSGGFNGSKNYFGPIFSNLFPVQTFNETKDLVEIFYDQTPIPIISKYLSYRYISGSIDVGIRVVSNVGQTGCLQVTQASGVMRSFYSPTEEYQGLRFINSSISSADYVSNGFLVFDISTNRNVSISTMRHESNRITDLMKKFVSLQAIQPPFGNIDNLYKNNQVYSQFLEDWLLFSPQGDFPAASGSEFTLCFYFDFSKISFLIPFYATPVFLFNFNEQIIDFLQSVMGKKVNTIIPDSLVYRPVTLESWTTLLDKLSLNL